MTKGSTAPSPKYCIVVSDIDGTFIGTVRSHTALFVLMIVCVTRTTRTNTISMLWGPDILLLAGSSWTRAPRHSDPGERCNVPEAGQVGC
jgi:hypothetical protein